MPTNVKVLLVDDNPMVLGMLRQALSSIATISTATDGADALLKAVEDPPDLLISDYQMPGMDGRQLVEKLKSRPATASTSVILLASKSDIADKLSMQEPVDDMLEKPFFLKEATTRIKRLIDKIALEKMAREAPGGSVFRGSLAQMNVIDLVQSLEMGRKSCSLIITHDHERCEMFFVEGQIRHATYDKLKGDPAVYKVLSWTEGNFQIDFDGRSNEKSTTQSTQGLLMEGLRLLDEANKGAEDNVLGN
jgi:CheY-like chemotaxis protein